MTHDELLAKIDKQLTCYCGHPDLCDGVQSKEQAPSWYALRAVVELHTPEKIIMKGFKTEYWCTADNNEPTPYPCPTILQIEKEIK